MCSSDLLKMQATDYYMHWIPHGYCYLFIYKMPMHRKRVRLKSQWLEYNSYIEKVFTKMSYLLRIFLAFGPNDGCYGHIHDIVCSNVPIFYKNMHLESTDNVYEESFPFHCIKKTIFYFSSVKNGFFCKTPTTNMLQNLRNTFFENTRPCYMRK